MRQTYSKDLRQNPRKFDEFKRAYDLPALLSTIVVLMAITGLCHLGSWIFVDKPSRDGTFGLLFPWLLLALSALLMFATRRALAVASPGKIPQALWLQSTVQIWWMGALVWYASTPLALIMLFVVSAAAINDARYLYDTPAARLSHLVPWLAFPPVLLGIDLAGGPGLLARYAVDPYYVKYALGGMAGMVLLLQFVISVVGRQCYETDAALWERGKLEAQLAEERREREVLRRSCDLMVQGVSAGSFSHDVASPLSLVSMAADEISELLTSRAEPRDAAELRTNLEPALEQLRRATNRVTEMTSALARSLRKTEEPSKTSVHALLSEALEAAKLSLRRYGLEHVPEAMLDVADGDVFVVAGHAGALANIIVNGALQQPREALVVTGRVSNDYYYSLQVRDFGVAPSEREQALEAVRASLAIATEQSLPARDAQSNRYGVALMLAKLLVVRHGGWLEVTSPDGGAGLVFGLTLPRLDPSIVPLPAHDTERASGVVAHQLAPSAVA
jgi:signal transduction histidine kinase